MYASEERRSRGPPGASSASLSELQRVPGAFSFSTLQPSTFAEMGQPMLPDASIRRVMSGETAVVPTTKSPRHAPSPPAPDDAPAPPAPGSGAEPAPPVAAPARAPPPPLALPPLPPLPPLVVGSTSSMPKSEPQPPIVWMARSQASLR
jgi:hypothetical protein